MPRQISTPLPLTLQSAMPSHASVASLINSQYDSLSLSDAKNQRGVSTMTRPLESEYAPYYQSYVARVSEDDVLPVLRSQLDELDVLLSKVKPDGETYAYADGKWSIRELVGH